MTTTQMQAECEVLAREAESKRAAALAAWEAGQVELSEQYDEQASAREAMCYDLAARCGLR